MYVSFVSKGGATLNGSSKSRPVDYDRFSSFDGLLTSSAQFIEHNRTTSISRIQPLTIGTNHSSRLMGRIMIATGNFIVERMHIKPHTATNDIILFMFIIEECNER